MPQNLENTFGTTGDGKETRNHEESVYDDTLPCCIPLSPSLLIIYQVSVRCVLAV